jgi:cobalamin biosynthesis protein CbiG
MPDDPPWFAVGVGLASAATPAEVADLVAETLRAAGVGRDRVRTVATVDSRADHPALATLGWPIVTFPPSALASATPRPPTSDTPPPLDGPAVAVSARVATNPASRLAVAEPAALLAAGSGAVLVVPKRRSARATVAVAAAAPATRPRNRRPDDNVGGENGVRLQADRG